MFQCTRTTKIMPHLIVVVWMAALIIFPGMAYANTQSIGAPGTFLERIETQLLEDTRCAGLRRESAFCNIQTELRYHSYLNTPATLHERFSVPPEEPAQPRADLLAVFKLALEEFDFLSGMRIYWDYTERNIEEWAVKLRLKGEISISVPDYYSENPSPNAIHPIRHAAAGRAVRPSFLKSLFTPDTIKWNLGLNPSDMAVFGDIRINRFLSISGEVGDESQVGLYFSYAF